MFSKYISISILLLVNCSFAVILPSHSGIKWDSNNYSKQNVKYLDAFSQEYYGQKYPVYAKPYSYNQVVHNPYIRPNPNLYYTDPYYPQSAGANFRQNIMDVLYSIARNDDLQCVPKILCEITSGTLSARQYGENFNLPINVNLDSLRGILSMFNGLQSSPLIYFGTAALLGYTSKGNINQCSRQYPRCPTETDKLVQYLNNHNGGFFRYFNGIRPQSYAPFYQQFHNPIQFRTTADKRIQNTPVTYINSNSIVDSNRFVFPNRVQEESKSSFRFPEYHRTSKKLNFESNFVDFQKPLPNHKATPFIFPDRTGTGQLILDSDDLNRDVSNIQYNDIRNFYFNPNKSGRKLHFPDR